MVGDLQNQMTIKGLTDEEVTLSRKLHGKNVIPESKPTTFFEAFKETFSDPMIRILLVMVAIMLVLYFIGYAEIYESVGTIVAVFLVAFFSAKTEVASDTKYRELKARQKKDTCKLLRNGLITIYDINDIVVGDIVLLQSGDKIPADGILISGRLSVDNSALNGETEECKKTAAPQGTKLAGLVTGETLVDKHSLFRGTTIFDGEGYLEVQSIGTATMMGKMANEMNTEDVDSPLKVKLSKLANQISTFGYVGATVIAILYMIYFIVNAGGISPYFAKDVPLIFKDIIQAVSLAIVIIVCAVPEGLPLMISLVLMQNTSRMLDHNVLVRKAIGIETAGSLNILFSDKTGTITKGKLEVVEFIDGQGNYHYPEELSGLGEIRDLTYIAIGKNTASMYDSFHQVVGGNATDQALLKFIGEDTHKLLNDRAEYTVTEEQGFNSTNKFSQAYIEGIGKTVYKGAPEKLLSKAKFIVTDNVKTPCAIDIDKLNTVINQLACKAMRVIALGYSEKPMVQDEINDDLVLIGLVAIRDDVRPEAINAIKQVQDAGIQVVMITGDRYETAIAIAEDSGLMRQGTADIAITSTELGNMTDEEIAEKLPNIRVIARALPTDKARMVKICQDRNLVVGMTGDGVNDSPALKKADVGFAMGSGTEAAKEAGEIVILNDNFKSIKDAIWYGRTIYHNILKFCKFQLVINVAAVIVSALAPFFGVEEPLKVTHLLFVNLVMDGLGAIMLGNEPALKQYMAEPPRKRDESLVSRSMMVQIGVMGAWLTVISFAFLKMPIFDTFFANEEQKLTAYFVLFILSALCNGFNVRDELFGIFKGLNENTGFLKVFIAIIAVQAFIVNAALIPLAPFQWISSMFSCVPFGINGWIVVFLLALTMIPIDIIRKLITAGVYNKH